ncbi:hypothetical protein QM268_02835 [Acinetobacter baumannii]|nr:hypothetical protein [Acinetobacter baumannii]MDI9691400.1 hypothetical protein [Acinetobacter baumannii]
MTDLNKGREVNLRFEQDDGAVWVFAGDSQFGTEISHLMMMHADEYNEDELRVICHHAACEIDRLRAELEKAKAQAVQQSFEIGRLQDRITELLDERQDLYAQINNDQAVPEGYVLVPKEIPDSVVSCLENSGFHWGDGTRDHYTPIYSLMVEVASESGAEQ